MCSFSVSYVCPLFIDRTSSSCIDNYDIFFSNPSCEEMIAGCIEDSRRHNGSICCSRFFSKTKQINEFGSCTMTRQSKLDKEYLASSQRGFIILFRQNVHDSIGTADCFNQKCLFINQKKFFFFFFFFLRVRWSNHVTEFFGESRNYIHHFN